MSHLSARERETRRRREERRVALERAYREWVVGGPLIDHAAPVIGGPGDAQHMALVQAELEQRALTLHRETRLLAFDFARRCLVRRAERVRMLAQLHALMRRTGAPGVAPTHSTSSAVPTTAGTIPRL